MSADGLATGLIEATLNRFPTSNIERRDDFTIVNLDNNNTLNISPGEDGDTLEIFENDAHVETINIPAEGANTEEFHKAITRRTISFLNV